LTQAIQTVDARSVRAADFVLTTAQCTDVVRSAAETVATHISVAAGLSRLAASNAGVVVTSRARIGAVLSRTALTRQLTARFTRPAVATETAEPVRTGTIGTAGFIQIPAVHTDVILAAAEIPAALLAIATSFARVSADDADAGSRPLAGRARLLTRVSWTAGLTRPATTVTCARAAGTEVSSTADALGDTQILDTTTVAAAGVAVATLLARSSATHAEVRVVAQQIRTTRSVWATSLTGTPASNTDLAIAQRTVLAR
jgi:hypothetical protein